MLWVAPVARSSMDSLFWTGRRALRSRSCSASETVLSHASHWESAENAAAEQKATTCVLPPAVAAKARKITVDFIVETILSQDGKPGGPIAPARSRWPCAAHHKTSVSFRLIT